MAELEPFPPYGHLGDSVVSAFLRAIREEEARRVSVNESAAYVLSCNRLRLGSSER